MRFYLINPRAGSVWDGQRHWLLGTSNRAVDEAYYPAGCGQNVLGKIWLSDKFESVTCPSCQVELIAARLQDEVRMDEMDNLDLTTLGYRG